MTVPHCIFWMGGEYCFTLSPGRRAWPGGEPAVPHEAPPSPRNRGLVVLAWLAVSVPLLWGVWSTIQKAAVLFRQ